MRSALPQLKADCKTVFGESVDVDTLFADAAAELEASEHRQMVQELYDKIEHDAEHCDYDIWSMQDMFDWTPASNTDPKLLEQLEQVYGKALEVTEDFRKQFLNANRDERIRLLTLYGGQKLLLSQERWVRVFDNVMDDEKMLRYVTLFGVKLDSTDIALIVRLLLYNDELYDEVRRRV